MTYQKPKLLSGLLACAIALCSGAAAAQTIKIGLLNSTSGVFATLGDQIDKSVKLYMKENAGKLPPGVTIKRWFDKDHNWAYAIAVYMPSMTAKVRDVGKMMDDANLLGDEEGGRAGLAGQGGGVEKPKGPVPVEAGPTGKVGGKDL